MFIRKKGNAYHYLVENKRVAGKIRQRIIFYLGKQGSLEGALAYWQQTVELCLAAAKEFHGLPTLVHGAEVNARRAQAKVDQLHALITANVGPTGHYTPAAADPGEYQAHGPTLA